MIGTLLNERYLLEAEVGRGGMGVIYRATDRVLRRSVAVKLLTDEGLGTEGRARLLQEARAAAGLNHPNIISIYDVGEVILPDREAATPYIIMEYIPGQSLRTYRFQDLEMTLHAFEQVCSALEVAHDNGVIHRDLKPDNIIVSSSGSVKLMDFGLAHTGEAPLQDAEGAISGTLAYMAPELLLGQSASEKSDLYALGLIFYEMLAGRPPYAADNLAGLLSQRLHSSIAPPSTYNEGVPPLLDALIMRLLSRQPADRPGHAGAVRHTIASLVSIPAGLQHSYRRMPDEPGVPLGRLVRGRLVGREQLLSQVVAAWQRVSSAEGRLMLFSGEPGIGKTRLARELTTYAELSGGKVYTTECYAEAGLPYASLGQIIANILTAHHGLQLAEDVQAGLRALMGDGHREPSVLIPQSRAVVSTVRAPEQTSIVDSVFFLFDVLVAQSPVLLFFDDLHWADSSSLRLLRQLVRRMRHQPLLVIGAYRRSELVGDQPLRHWLEEIRFEPWATQLELARLDKVQTKELLGILFSTEVSWDFVEEIYSQTEGNPFFIEEVCRALVEHGRLYFQGGRWHWPSVDVLDIPQGLRVVIQSRLRNFAQSEMEVLELAAVLGREFRYDMLLTISGLHEERLITVLEKAVQAQLLEEVKYLLATPQDTLSFTFSQALIRSTILSNLSTMRRRWLQHRVASALENAYLDQLDQLAPMLARYFAESGSRSKAAEYWLRAGDAANRLFAYEEAVGFYERALPHLQDQDDYAGAARTLMKLGLANHNAFHFNKAHKAYEDGFALWQRIPAAEVKTPVSAENILKTHFRGLDTIDPTRSNQVSSGILIQQLFCGLVELSPDHEVIPDVALSWEVLDDGRRYIFHLRDDVRWSDGHPVTAGDFEYAWKRVLDPSRGPYPAELLCDIRNGRLYHEGKLQDPHQVGVRAVDDWTLFIDLEGPTSYFLHLLTQPVGKPVPRHVVEATQSDWTRVESLVVNGAFKIKEWHDGRRLILEANESYHGKRSGNLGAVEVLLIDNPEDGWQLYQKNQLDCLYLTPLFSPGRLENARQHYPDQYITGPTPSTIFLAFNVTTPPFDDVRVRQAMAYATDKETLSNVSLTGLFPPANGGFVPRGMPGHISGIGFPHNVAKARELLAQAGYPEGHDFPTINARVLNASIYHVISRSLNVMWREALGLNIQFQPMPPVDGAHVLLAAVAPDYLDADTFLRANNWSPQTGWQHPVFEQLVEQARRVKDRTQRLSMYREAEAIVAKEVPLLPLAYNRIHLLLKPWVSKYPVSPLLSPYWKDTIVETH